ncbi:hypothetical protein [Flavobacterium sp.]|uniref:hypothetical protein n=1 Tax=Flavobacterium sp. TaxID=239 RepID=UPI004047515A
MKTTTFILNFLFFGIIGYSQIETKIITVDLSKPHEGSISSTNNFKWLSAKSKEMISIQLVNGNPLKYDYKIDTKNISLHNNDESEVSEIKKSVADNNLKQFYKAKLTTPLLQNIIDSNSKLITAINSLNATVDVTYEILKLKNTISKDDFENDRESYIDKAKNNSILIFELIMDLEQLKGDTKYSTVNKMLHETKEKAEKSINNIINKFYTIDLDIYTLPIDIQGQNIDAIEFKLQRFDKETKEEDVNFASKPYNIWIKGGLKIDVSAGIFFSSVYDHEFDKKDDLNTPGNKIITLKNRGDYDFAFGSTVNTYIRMNSWVVPSINFGAALTANQKFQFLLGVGAILGKQERIIFTTGLAMGKVERIADSYSVGGSYNLGDSGTIPTQTQFKFGHFFGITYNLSKVKKISLEKGIE